MELQEGQREGREHQEFVRTGREWPELPPVTVTPPAPRGH